MHPIQPIILTRIDSTRIPGKAFLPVFQQLSSLQLIIEGIDRLSQIVPEIRVPIIATTDRDCDSSIAHLLPRDNLVLYRGAYSPLERLLDLSDSLPLCWMWRLNADSPFLLIDLLEYGIKQALSAEFDTIDCVTNLYKRTFPYGISLELYNSRSFCQLRELSCKIINREDIAQVQKFIKEEKIINVSCHNIDFPNLLGARLTLDTPEDLASLSRAYLLAKEEGLDNHTSKMIQFVCDVVS